MTKLLELQVRKQAMLSGSVILLRPIWALSFGGVAEALLFQQLFHRAGGLDGVLDPRPVRLSYTRLRKLLPFFSRRWIIEIVCRLEGRGAIEVTRGSRVNVYSIRLDYLSGQLPEITQQNKAAMLLFPELARKVGVLEAVVIQQIHIRHHDCDGSVWVIRSFKQWHSDVFMFMGLATVKRLFSKLEKLGWIFVKPYQTETGIVNSYRVDYLKIAEVLGIPVPSLSAPKKKSWDGNSEWDDSEWTNPLYPIKPLLKVPQ